MIRLLLWSMVLGTLMVALVAALANAQSTGCGIRPHNPPCFAIAQNKVKTVPNQLQGGSSSAVVPLPDKGAAQPREAAPNPEIKVPSQHSVWGQAICADSRPEGPNMVLVDKGGCFVWEKLRGEAWQVHVPDLGCPKGTEPTLTGDASATTTTAKVKITPLAYWDCGPPQSGEK